MSGKFDILYGLAYIVGMMNTAHSEPVERSYREKLAWLSLLTTIVLYVPYFFVLGRGLAQGELFWPQLLAFSVGVVVLQALLLPAGLLAWWLLGQRAPDLPADERDRAIDARATKVAYVVLVVAGFTLPFTILSVQTDLLRSPALLLGFFACFVLAEVVRFSLQVIGYRRGS